MKNEMTSVNNILSYTPNYTSIIGTSSLDTQLSSIVNAKNIHEQPFISQGKFDENSHADIGSGEETEQEREQIDYLFRCFVELKKNLDLLLKPGAITSIPVQWADKHHVVSVARILLPSGNDIHAGLFGNRLIVSHGQNYFIENRMPVKVTVLGTLVNLMAHAALEFSYVYSRGSGSGFVETIKTWFGGLRDPLVFPSAAGQTHNLQKIPIHNVLYQSATAIEAQYEPSNNTGPNNDIFPVQSPTFAASRLSPSANISADTSGRDAIIFNIGGHELTLSSPPQHGSQSAAKAA
ncbi:hypothetical protein ABK905_14495 [Acerihabitans sp. KWT182]|uniref:Uncharacterized protein n=1 Tax=Acerihabitans sp. KWT182 TaxID=3157919 RepID=A0AAU7Q4W0_9GAMM